MSCTNKTKFCVLWRYGQFTRTRNTLQTRMHSSRMRTARLLPVSPSMHCPWVVYLPGGLPGGSVYLLVGCTCLGACTCPGGTCPGTPPVNRMTERCKNITLPQTSFAVITLLQLDCITSCF